MDATTLVENCYKALPSEMRYRPWEYTDHGRKVLSNDEELNAYLAAYGEIHIVKCRVALQNFPFDDLQMYAYEIFDWGCGQGIATLTLLDMLRERNKLSGLKKITLVEPSLPALTRARQWTAQFAGPGVEIVAVNKFIPSSVDEKMDEVLCKTQVSINLMSNILDIKSLSLKWMAEKTSNLAIKNYMVCVGPKFSQGTNTRINDFCGYFNQPVFFSAISSFPYAYTTKTHHPFGCETRCFMYQRGTEINHVYNECADEEDFTDDYDYAANCMKGIISDTLLHLYNMLRVECGNSYDIFLCPSINSDKVDIVLTSISKGILLINVCDDIENLAEEYTRLEAIKSNIFNSLLKTIKFDSIINNSVFNCIKTGIYVPGHSNDELQEAIVYANKEMNDNAKEQNPQHGEKNYFAYVTFVTEDENTFTALNRIKSKGFKSDYYDEFVKAIVGNWHSFNDGIKNFKLNKIQEKIVRDERKRIRYKGVAGCGKTQIVANRAVEQHLRTGEKVLIVTFNISLIQYIRMRISQVPADFSMNMFEIVSYHQFFKSKANLCTNKSLSLSDWDDKDFFKPYATKVERYKTIIIDEVQDFKEAWLYSIITYFLNEDGTVSVFGDGEQNVFDREMDAETKMPPMRGMGYSGRWPEISERVSMRILNPQVATVASMFAHEFVSDEMPPIILQDNMFDNYFIKYGNVGMCANPEKLAKYVKGIINTYKLNSRDVVVMAESINILREIVYHYKIMTNEKVMINFETKQQYDDVRKKTSPMYIKKDLDDIRRAAKTHFTTFCDEIKMSTIQSFKGWESDSVILFLQPENNEHYDSNIFGIVERENTPALIYTALTRAKCNLFIINLGNEKYETFFKNKINH